jgi:hypothetical protein
MDWLEGIERKFGKVGKITAAAAILLAIAMVKNKDNFFLKN